MRRRKNSFYKRMHIRKLYAGKKPPSKSTSRGTRAFGANQEYQWRRVLDYLYNEQQWSLEEISVWSGKSKATIRAFMRRKHLKLRPRGKIRGKLRSRGQSLTIWDVGKIRKLLAEGHTQASVARMFLVSPSTISRIATGKSWRGAYSSPAFSGALLPPEGK